jgi:hypothetical protein
MRGQQPAGAGEAGQREQAGEGERQVRDGVGRQRCGSDFPSMMSHSAAADSEERPPVRHQEV